MAFVVVGNEASMMHSPLFWCGAMVVREFSMPSPVFGADPLEISLSKMRNSEQRCCDWLGRMKIDSLKITRNT